MAAPLKSANPGPPQSMQFAHFGVLDAGAQSKASTLTSVLVNVAIAFVVIVISLAHRQILDNTKRLTELTEPIIAKKVEPVKPKIVPPRQKPLPNLARLEPPKITIPQVKLPELPKQPIVKMDQPKPVLLPPAPPRIFAKAAPVAVSLAHPQAASVVNNDPHPSAVRLGNSTSPLNNLKGPSVASVNLAAGMPGMNSANSGNGPAATKVVMGNGSPGSTTIKGNGVIAAVGIPHGIPHGIPGATGTGPAQVGQVNLGQAPPPLATRPTTIASVAPGKAVKVISKPKPEYTAEAREMHIEGVVTLHIRVLTDGSVQVVGVTRPLGYGLDDSARRAIMATKFEPATDSSGHPIAWEGNVNVTFQLAG